MGELPTAYAPGTQIAGQYVITRVLGRGGMGVVVEAEHKHLPRRVAIKLLKSLDSETSGGNRQLLREARIVAKLKSPRIPRILDVYVTENGAPYIVMELLHGITLAEYVKRHGPLPWSTALEYAAQAAEALVDAHGAGVVHRDIKPSNLFLETGETDLDDGIPAGQLKLLDFGIARVIARDGGSATASTLGNVVAGSPPFMSPEQTRGENVDVRADIWSLGATLHYLLTGKAPFEGPSLAEVFCAILTLPTPQLPNTPKGMPTGVQRLLNRCLEKRRQDRFQTATELRQELLRIHEQPDASEDTFETLALGPSSKHVAQNPRRRALQVGGALLAVPLVAGIASLLHQTEHTGALRVGEYAETSPTIAQVEAMESARADDVVTSLPQPDPPLASNPEPFVTSSPGSADPSPSSSIAIRARRAAERSRIQARRKNRPQRSASPAPSLITPTGGAPSSLPGTGGKSEPPPALAGTGGTSEPPSRTDNSERHPSGGDAFDSLLEKALETRL